MTPQVNTALVAQTVQPHHDPHAEHHAMMPGMVMPQTDDNIWDNVLAATRSWY
uniref:hypothetical protein n=1 Tax=Pantoea sp. IMH TaxID=1267600 RepID=UPI0004AD3F7C